MQYRYDLSVQEQIDRKMCKPGYTWNDTLGKCLGGYGGGGGEPEEPQETPDGAVKQEKVKRAKEKAPPAPKQ